MKKIIYALRFLTTIPIKWKENEKLSDIAESVEYFPLIGIIIGYITSLVFFYSSKIFSPLLSSTLSVISWILITGALHLDGVADSADGLFGGTTKERKLEIMKDSSIGTFGVISLIIFILLKLLLINELANINITVVLQALLIAPVIARWNSLFLIFSFGSAREDGLGSFFKKYINIRHLLKGLLLTALLLLITSGFEFLFIIVLTSFISFILSLWISKKIGGLTGDIYGALCELTEIITIFTVLIWLNLH